MRAATILTVLLRVRQKNLYRNDIENVTLISCMPITRLARLLPSGWDRSRHFPLPLLSFLYFLFLVATTDLVHQPLKRVIVLQTVGLNYFFDGWCSRWVVAPRHAWRPLPPRHCVCCLTSLTRFSETTPIHRLLFPLISVVTWFLPPARFFFIISCPYRAGALGTSGIRRRETEA